MTTPTSSTETSHLPGMACAGAAFALLTAVDTIFKVVALGHPAHQILMVNACFALVPIVLWTLITGGLQRLNTRRLGQHLARGSTSVMAAFAAIYAYSRLPLTDFYAIVFAGPLIVTVLSVFWLGEKVGIRRWSAILIGFSGIVIVINPFEVSGGAETYPILVGRFAALVSVFCYALSTIVVRRMRISETSMTFAFYGYVSCTVIAGTIFLFRGGPALQWYDILHLAISGTLAGISSICLMTAYHRSPVALVAPFQYTQIIWGALAGYFLWAHVPDIRLIIGATIVGSSGLFVIYRELRVKDQKL